MSYTIAAFYRFTPLADAAACRDACQRAFAPLGLCGTLLVAPEGINGTIAGRPDAIAPMLAFLGAQAGLRREEVKFSSSQEKPFDWLKIRLKREIITFNQPAADPASLPGIYVAPKDWNRLLDDPDVTVIDTRNVYETAIGTFAQARDPQIERFTGFAAYVRATLDPARTKKVAMYCTGGIRCEKASSFMRAEGFAEVYHLQGGILRYLEEIPAAESRWRGDCYVFDKRMAVGHGVAPRPYTMCACCGYPLAADDVAGPLYETGVSCGYCHGHTSPADKARFRERQRQMMAAGRAGPGAIREMAAEG